MAKSKKKKVVAPDKPFMSQGKVTRGGAGSRIALDVPGFNYTTQAKPCTNTKRKTCPVQFFFDKGRPKLRFCRPKKGPGFTVAVSSPEEAQKIAAEACKCWEKTKDFGKCDVTSKLTLGRLNATRQRLRRLQRQSRPRPPSRPRGRGLGRVVRFAGLGGASR